MPPSDHLSDAQEWLRYAEADLAIAQMPLPSKGLYEHLAFHTQQAAEKAIKAVFVLYGVTFPKTHNIEFLMTLLPKRVSQADLPSDAYKLTGYATIFRYPGEEEPMTEDELEELEVIAQGVVDWAGSIIATEAKRQSN